MVSILACMSPVRHDNISFSFLKVYTEIFSKGLKKERDIKSESKMLKKKKKKKENIALAYKMKRNKR